MKKIISYLLVLIMLVPCIVLADYKYDDGVKKTDTYIFIYSDYARYIKIKDGIPYGFSGSSPVQKDGFKFGGFITKPEYDITNSGPTTSWLAPGIEYWLIDKWKLNIKPINGSDTDTSGVRITEYVLHNTKVKGTGSITNPWTFIDGYNVKVGVTDKSIGQISPENGYEHVGAGEGAKEFILTYDNKYALDTRACENAASAIGATFSMVNGSSANTKKITINNISKDFSCFIDFGTNCYAIAFNNNGGIGGIGGQQYYYQYGKGWFSDNICKTVLSPSITSPTRVGYTYQGYKYKINNTYGKTIVNTSNTLVPGVKDSDVRSDTAYAHWTPNTYTITLDNAQATTDGTSVIYEKYDTGWYSDSGAGTSITTITKPLRTNYTFTGYYDGTTQIIDKDGKIIAANNEFSSNKTLNAHWELTTVTCTAGNYLPAATNACVPCLSGKYCPGDTFTVSLTQDQGLNNCPNGYANSNVGSSAATNCYMNVDGGKYVKTAKDVNPTTCSKGYYKGSHTVFYNSTSTCTQCPAGYRDGSAATEQSNCQRTVAAGKYLKNAKDTTDTACGAGYYNGEHTVNYGSTSSCTQCPAGYRNGSGTTQESNCQRTVAAGKYLKNAKDTTDTACGAGYYNGEHKVNFGSTSSCTQCPAGYRDGGAATAESGCIKSVAKGKYVKTAKGDAINCPKGYYAASVRNVTYGNTNGCTKCPGGKTTAGTGSTSSSACVGTKRCYRPEYANVEKTIGGVKYACEDSTCPTHGACAGCGWDYLIGDCGGQYQGSVNVGGTTYYYCNRIWATCAKYSGAVHPCIRDYGSVYTVAASESCPAYYCTSSPCKHGPHG